MPLTQQNILQIIFALVLIQISFWFGLKYPFQIEKNEQYQFNLWSGSREFKPDLAIVPTLLSYDSIKALSFGDEQVAFRYYGYLVQMSGDSFGRVTPLKNYDYEKLYKWWSLLDRLDPKSDYMPYLVAYYFSASQTPEKHLPYVVKYLEEHSDLNPQKKWWWYSQAYYNAKFGLDDLEWSLKIAKKLYDLPKDLDIPMWTRQLQAFVYEDKGEYKQACDIILNILRDFNEDKLKPSELNYIYYFIQDRVRKMIENEKLNPNNADISPECRAIMNHQKEVDSRN
jgi:hypothetical protein